MLKNIPIALKLPFTIVALCILAVGTMGYMASNAARSILEEQGRARLHSVLNAQDGALLGTLEAWRTSVVSQSISPVARGAITDFIGAFEAIPGNKTDHLRTRYITENEHPAGQRHLLDFTTGRDAYNRAHRKYHPYFRSLVEKNRYSDLLLLDGVGNVLFSVMKGDDYAVDLREKAFADTGLAQAFNRVMHGGEQAEFVFADFSDYPLADMAYSGFMAAPVLASNNAVIGVFVARLDAAALATSGQATRGLGKTGTAFVVGADNRLRRSTGSSQEAGQAYTPPEGYDPALAALQGGSGVMTSKGADGARSLAVYEPFEYQGTHWAVIAQQDTGELYADAARLNRSTWVQGLALMSIAGLIALLFARTILNPLTTVRAAMSDVSDGKYQTEIPQTDRADEIGGIAKTLDQFRQSLLAARETEQQAILQGTALDATSACLMIIDRDLTIRHANDATLQLLQEHREALSESWRQFDADRIDEANLAELLPDCQKISGFLARAQPADGEIDLTLGAARLTLSIQTVGDGNEGAVIEWIDKTEQFRQSALIASIDQRQCLVEFDLTGTIVGANSNFCALIETGTTELIGVSIEELIEVDPSKLKDGVGFWQGILADGAVWGQFRVNARTDHHAWIDGGITVVADGGGAPLSVVMIGNDVSQTRTAIEAANHQQQVIVDAQRAVVAELGAALSRLSAGDLTVEIGTAFQGEYEKLRNDFNTAVESLLHTMQDLVTSTATIQKSASDVSNSTDDLLEKTESQATTLADTAAEISQLTNSLATTAKMARDTSEIVVGTHEHAIASGQVVEEAVETMAEIETSSKVISGITKVIEDIAFQTNLLALNAGVEAARAGEAGRGFAVVASEVRALSQRSSDAANEINSVIVEANGQIERGAERVSAAGGALRKIFESIKGIASNVEEIASSAAIQSKGLAEIDGAVGALDRVTRRNASLLSETAASGHSLKHEANGLAAANARFNVGRNNTPEPTQPDDIMQEWELARRSPAG